MDLALEEGLEPALVSLPLGARDRRPILVATHGAGGRAEPHCRFWRELIGPRPFILCPRGRRTLSIDPGPEPGFYYPGHPQLAREVEAALAAVVARWGAWVDPTEPIYAGYSQGAGMGAMMIPTHAGKFARALFVEGGFGQYQEWNIAAARRWRDNGGRRALLACGRPACFELAKESGHWLELGGIGSRVVYGAGAGHTYGGAVAEQIRDSLPWLLEGDARW
jgi:predicted esterase